MCGHYTKCVILATALWGVITVTGAEGPRGSKEAATSRPLTALRRGLNLGGWFAQLPPSRERFKEHITAEDAARIKKLGCTFVRLPVDPLSLTDPKTPEAFDAENLKLFDAALDMFHKEGLAVIICPYLNDEPKHRVLVDTKATEAFLSFWGMLAKHLAARPVDKTFLQVMNEPSTNNQQGWDILQGRIVAAIRSAAARHTIIASSNLRANDRWDPIGGFVAGKPVDDQNVIYDFHFYDPVQFTHQGAGWMMWQVKEFKNLPYPSNPENIRPHLARMASPGAKAYAKLYGRERWDKHRLEKQILRAVQWGKKHKVPILCGEFGAYRPNAPEADRFGYLQDVREVLETHGIGWAMWDYLGDFGVVVEKDGKRSVDEKTAQALGLSRMSPKPVKD